MADEFDFKEEARTLLKRLTQTPGAPMSQGLAVAALEAALREAYARGRGDLRAKPARVAAAPVRTLAPVKTPAPAPECAHEWEEGRCTECGVFQRDVQQQCDHYFVKVGAQEICMACRKPRKPQR